MDRKDNYLKFKWQGEAALLATYTERNVGYVIEAIGKKGLMAYDSSDGKRFKECLTKKGSASSSVKRIFSTIWAITNLVVAE